MTNRLAARNLSCSGLMSMERNATVPTRGGLCSAWREPRGAGAAAQGFGLNLFSCGSEATIAQL